MSSSAQAEDLRTRKRGVCITRRPELIPLTRTRTRAPQPFGALTPGERHLMAELLDRVAGRAAPQPTPDRAEPPMVRSPITPS